jgi:hypothetical protein
MATFSMVSWEEARRAVLPPPRVCEPLTPAPAVRPRRRRRPKGQVAAVGFGRESRFGRSVKNEVARRASSSTVAQGSFGSDSDMGSQSAEPLLTVVATCRQQGRSLLDFLVAAVAAALRGSRPPSLLSALLGS